MYVGAAHSSDIVTFKTIPTGELEIIHNTSTRSSSRSGVTRQTDPLLDFRCAIHHGIILVHDRPKQIDMEPLPVRFQYRFDQSYVSRYALFDHSALQVSCRHSLGQYRLLIVGLRILASLVHGYFYVHAYDSRSRVIKTNAS